jgi:hypothetical protein
MSTQEEFFFHSKGDFNMERKNTAQSELMQDVLSLDVSAFTQLSTVAIMSGKISNFLKITEEDSAL